MDTRIHEEEPETAVINSTEKSREGDTESIGGPLEIGVRNKNPPEVSNGDFDEGMIGSESEFDESDDDEDRRLPPPPTQKVKQKNKPENDSKEVRLRRGAKVVSEEELEAANRHLKSLPQDYKWISRVPNVKSRPVWQPLANNDPKNTADFTGKSLLNIFLQMAESCLLQFMECTNRVGRKLYPRAWPELTSMRVVLFVSLIFHMDVVQLANMNSYWSKKRPDAFVQSTGISRNKFMMWYSNLRLYDVDSTAAEERRTNKIYKVDKYLTLAQKAMQSMRNTTSQNLSLDEEMSTFKGRCGLVQIIKGKPRGEGLKYYALCDPKSGYVYATQLHSGTPIPHQNVWGRIVATCYNLLSGLSSPGLHTFLDQGYYVYTDRYYTTVEMNYAMTFRDTYFCGTLRREQRSHLPVEIMLGTKRGGGTPAIVKNLQRGQILRMFSNYVIFGDTTALSWMDNTLVTFLTSVDEATDDPVICYRRQQRRKKKGHSRLAVSQPSTAKDFNINMQGVDVHDENCTSVKKHHRSRRWYVSGVLLQSLDWFAHNTFIIWKDFNLESKIKNKDIKEILKEELCTFARKMGNEPLESDSDSDLDLRDDFGGTSILLERKNPQVSSTLKHRNKVYEVNKIRLDKGVDHFPRRYMGVGRTCCGHMQRVTTTYFCNTCGVFLCIEGGCFGRFHKKKNYLFDDPKLCNRHKIRKQGTD